MIDLVKIERLRAELATANSFLKVAVADRDYERARYDRLRGEAGQEVTLALAEAKQLRAEIERLQKAHDHQYKMAGLMLREAEKSSGEADALRVDVEKVRLATLEAAADKAREIVSKRITKTGKGDYGTAEAVYQAIKAMQEARDET